jgi:hypothetical protein
LEFGERIHALIALDKDVNGLVRQHKLGERWTTGIWLGKTEKSDEHILYMPDSKQVLKFRTVRRMPEESRWDTGDDLCNMQALPWETNRQAAAAQRKAEAKAVAGAGTLPQPQPPRDARPKTEGCKKCTQGIGNKHSAECRRQHKAWQQRTAAGGAPAAVPPAAQEAAPPQQPPQSEDTTMRNTESSSSGSRGADGQDRKAKRARLQQAVDEAMQQQDSSPASTSTPTPPPPPPNLHPRPQTGIRKRIIGKTTPEVEAKRAKIIGAIERGS